METAILIIFLLVSVVLHEVAHGYAAEALGDPTARLAGRLTLNPLKHLDPLGSVVVPLLLFFSGGLVFGWAKPVPYNPYNLRAGKWGPALVAFAGPATNIALALVFGLALRFAAPAFGAAISLVGFIVLINLMLAIFNLIPVPPLDGSKILFALLPTASAWRVEEWSNRYQWITFLVLIFVLINFDFVGNIVFGLFRLLTGQAIF